MIVYSKFAIHKRSSFHDIMSDSERLLASDYESGDTDRPVRASNTSTCPGASNAPDLVDTFQLFKSYMDGKISLLEEKMDAGNESFAKKLREETKVKLKDEGNQIQFTFNSDIIADLRKLQKRIPHDDQCALNLLSGVIVKLYKRNKCIRIADKSPAGWRTVKEYESDDLASNFEDEKRLRSAENRAVRSINTELFVLPFYGVVR